MNYANYHDQVGYRARSIAIAFKLAINGSFHTSRVAGRTPTPAQKASGIANVQYAHFAYEIALVGLIDEVVMRSKLSPASSDLASQIEQMRLDVVDQIRKIGLGLSGQGTKAINSGHGNKAASLLSLTNTAHGAFGELVQAKLSKGVELTSKDTADRQWTNPEALVKTIVRDFAYKIYVKTKIQEAVLAGEETLIMFDGDQELSIATAAVDEYYDLFHINSNVVFGESDVST